MIQCHRGDEEVRLIELLEPVCLRQGYELLDLVWHGGNRLTVTLGKPKATVTIEDCAEMSELISRTLDVEDCIQRSYNLEVSSPGLERPLRTQAHFQEVCGKDIKIRLMKTRPLEKDGFPPQIHVTGTLLSVSESGVLKIHQRVGSDDRGICQIPISDLERAHLLISDEQLFSKGDPHELQ